MDTQWIGVLGYPLKQSLSKKIHEENIRVHYLPWKFRVLEWAPQEFEKNIGELKQDKACIGFSVTMPYKEEIISYLDECKEFALKVSSVNCVKNKNGKWVGANTDAPGFLTPFSFWNPCPPKTVNIVVLGVGATGRTLSFALAQGGYQNFIFINRTVERAQEWCGKFRKTFRNVEAHVGEWGRLPFCENLFILNTTPLGMKGEALDWLDVWSLKNPIWLFDVTYNPAETLLIRQCKSRCFYTMNGWPMFQEQARLAFKIWM